MFQKLHIYTKHIQKITFKRKNKYRCQRRLMNFSRHNFSKKKEISTRGYGKRIRKKLRRKCFGMVISVCKRFLHHFTNAMHKSVHILCSYRSVKYGKMINTEAALYIIERGRNFHYNCIIHSRYSLCDLELMGWIKDLFY